MDVDMMKSSSREEHMDMMMQTEKLPDFCSEPFYNTTNTSKLLQETQFSNGNTTASTTVSPHIYSNPLFSMPFMGTPIQEPATPSFQHDMMAKKIKYGPPFSNANSFLSSSDKKNSITEIRKILFRITIMQPIYIDPKSVKPPKRRNVKISKDPQSVVARHRRERISERIRIPQRLVPGGTKMGTTSMLDEAIHYVKFLKIQVNFQLATTLVDTVQMHG
ncbi:hypothetical protein DKX38_007876 [Salix brachista]|uniref:BHLH domain-containing protein n=1 Tax=Salix brachista TaxID=2182728 RepID=A0A5N5MPM6_9ROSI|nr:hypothetical protein DKX38_007876 [Salix brachista]